MTPIAYDTKSIAQALTDAPVGHTIRYFGSVPSTMPIARDLAEDASTVSGVLVVAEEQTEGRGRYDRRWETPYGAALLMSVILKPPHLLQPISRLSMLAGVAVAEGIVAAVPELGNRIRLKWPNDVLVGPAGLGRTPAAEHRPGKLAGILLESSFTGERADYAVLGIGINVSQEPEVLAAVRLATPGAPLQAASLAASAGRPVVRDELLIAICRRMGDWLANRATADTDALFLRWRELLATLGTEVTVHEHSTIGGSVEWHGRAVDVDPAGNLQVAAADGTIRIFNAGDVSLRAAHE